MFWLPSIRWRTVADRGVVLVLILAAWRPLIASAVALIVHRRSPSLLSDKKKPGAKPPGM